jgi:PPOX class probable F420-dependent enzyme
MNSADDPALDFLKSHRLGIFATGKRDGSPQQALISYNFDGSDIVVGTGWDSAKVKNLRRQPLASISIVDGPKVVVVYGEASIVRGEEADSIRAARLQPPRPAGATPARPPARTQAGERVVIRMEPQRIIANRLDD